MAQLAARVVEFRPVGLYGNRIVRHLVVWNLVRDVRFGLELRHERVVDQRVQRNAVVEPDGYGIDLGFEQFRLVR